MDSGIPPSQALPGTELPARLCLAYQVQASVGRQSLQGSAVPGRAWDRGDFPSRNFLTYKFNAYPAPGETGVGSSQGTLTTDTPGSASANLVGWWKFDEGTGSIALDSSGNGNNGTEVNGPSYASATIQG